ncbi:hypothetical protein CPLU01_02270 [Colletotrichum plurivorum]|uniref:Uncharacterized protein n=1 Tax=Colletotrichum plurivorum TaxID=2175906 RepID=A0A8H6KW23_9PEZI|nr:hypothetical protein CPLU01_02270 [Colletotrichum plurivorum]
MAPAKSAELAQYQATLINRIPTIVSAAYRQAVIETIERLVDNVNPEESSLRWRIQAAFHSDTEPASHEVIALALTFESGMFEGPLLAVQKTFYKNHMKIRKHRKEWSIPGLTGAINCAESDDDEINNTIDNGEGPSTQGVKRKINEVIDLTDDDDTRGKKPTTDPASSHVESENTPRLNQLAKGPPPIAERTPPPPRIVKVPSFALARLPAPPSMSPATPRANSDIIQNQPAPSPPVGVVAMYNKHKELTTKINTFHTQAVELNSHAETLRKELVATSERRAADDDESLKGLDGYLSTYNGLSMRILKCHEDTISVINKAADLQAEHNKMWEEVNDRLMKLEKAVTELVAAASREAYLRGDQCKQERN